MKQATHQKTDTSILFVSETKEFTKNLDIALTAVDSEKLKDVFVKSNLLNHPETKEFLSRGEYIFKTFNNPNQGIELINVEDRITRCSACTLGKVVKAFDVKYKKQEHPISVVYSSSFAVNLEIKDGELVDFGWCNFFLNKDEFKEIYD